MLIIAWEVTSACNLLCDYCRAGATPSPAPDELTTREGFALIDEVAHLNPMLILSGGEPILRHDIFDLAEHARRKGLRVSLATNGTLLDPDIVEKIADAGIGRVSISLDGASSEIHDLSRGQGTFLAAMKGIELLRGRVDFQINLTITRRNEAEIPAIIDLAEALGAKALHLFFLVPTGRARDEDLISSERQDQTLQFICQESSRRNLEIQVTCAPQYARILDIHGKTRGKRRSGGCLAGSSFVFISHRGEVYPCGYLPLLAGCIKDQSFMEIWENSPVLKALRERDLKGKCSSCGYRRTCGGCRARAFAKGDFLGEDPFCSYEAA